MNRSGTLVVHSTLLRITPRERTHPSTLDALDSSQRSALREFVDDETGGRSGLGARHIDDRRTRRRDLDSRRPRVGCAVRAGAEPRLRSLITGAGVESLRHDQRGSSTVEFVLVGTLLTLLTLGVLQLALAVYIRNVVHDAARWRDAYFGALADTDADAGAARTGPNDRDGGWECGIRRAV